MPPMRLTARDLAGARANLDKWQGEADSPIARARITYWQGEVERLWVEMDEALDDVHVH